MEKKWPVFDPSDFDGVTVDATKWENNFYTIAFSFFCNEESEEFEGFTLCTMISGETLKECYEKIVEVLNTEMFDEIQVSSHGTLFTQDGDEIEEICWNDIADQDEEVFSTTDITQSITLH